jgi:hypothetical protein
MILAAHRCAVGYRHHVEHLKQPPTLEGDREGVMWDSMVPVDGSAGATAFYFILFGN